MRKRWFRLLLAPVCCVLLCACDGLEPGSLLPGSLWPGGLLPSGNVEELLRAPRQSEQQNAVQTALNNYLGDSLQLKYPRGGSEPDPVIFADLDDDGAVEAAVLYTAPSKGQNVHLAVLESEEEGWSVAYEVMGLSSEVAEVEQVQLFDGSVQLCVGYANANLTDKYLEIYDYRDITIYSACRQPYDTYRIDTLTGEGLQLAVACTTAEPGASVLQLFAADGRTMALQQTQELDARLEHCTGIYPTVCGNAYGLIVDGTTAQGNAAQFFRWEDELFRPCTDDTEEQAVSLCQRPRALSALTPRDLAGTGETLAAEAGASIPTIRAARRFYPVDWVDHLSEKPLRRYGIYDTQYNCFVRLPEAWRGKISLSAQSDTDWQIRDAKDGRLLCMVRIVDRFAANGMYIEAAQLPDQKLLLHFSEACPPAYINLIQNGVFVLE